MSTTFGIKIPSTGEVKPIARRKGIGNGKVAVWFTEPIAELLPHELKVIPMDNTAQGIYTIGDIVLAVSNSGRSKNTKMETDKTLDAIDQFENHFSKEEQQGLIDRITKANRDFDKRVSEDVKNGIIESVRKIPNKGIKPDEYFRQIGRVTYPNRFHVLRNIPRLIYNSIKRKICRD